MNLHALWILNNTVTWVKINHENLVVHDFICIRNYQTDILDNKKRQLIHKLNNYYALLDTLQGIFQIDYVDSIIETAKDRCSHASKSIMESATMYIYCLKDELINYASKLRTPRIPRSILDLFNDRALNSEINSALAVTLNPI